MTRNPIPRNWHRPRDHELLTFLAGFPVALAIAAVIAWMNGTLSYFIGGI